MRALLVEEAGTRQSAVAMLLRSGRLVVDQAETGEEALELARHYDYDVVLLDLDLPDMDGYEVVRRMRAGRIDIPVVVLSSTSRPQAKVRAFELGADDLVTKPFDPAELFARIQAVVRRSKGYSRPTLEVGSILLNLDSREVTVNGQPIHLTAKEYAILELLMLRKGIVLSKETFLNHLYGGLDEPEMKIIDVFVCKLRKKLAQAGADGLVGTIWGCGYVMRDPISSQGAAYKPVSSVRQLTAA